MRFSKAWCGLFTTIGAGLGGAYYLASRGGAAIEKATNNFITNLLSKNLTMNNLNVTIHTSIFPTPLSASIDLQFGLKQILEENIVKTMEEFPSMLNEAAQAVVWEQAVIVLLVVTGISGLGMYIHKKMNESNPSQNKPETEPLLDNAQEESHFENIQDLEKQDAGVKHQHSIC